MEVSKEDSSVWVKQNLLYVFKNVYKQPIISLSITIYEYLGSNALSGRNLLFRELLLGPRW